MKKILGLFLILTIAFTSCDGRKTQHQALSDSIEEFKKTATFEIDIYNPESYVEREVDTLLSNGYRVKIKAFTDMDNSVLFTKIKDTINYQTHYRNFKFDIRIEKEGQLIYNKRFNKLDVNEKLNYNSDQISGSNLYNFDKLAVLKSIELVDESGLSNEVAIDIMYAIPESEKYALHRLIIDEHGTSNFVQIKVN